MIYGWLNPQMRNCRCQAPTIKLYTDFQLLWVSDPALFKGPLYFETLLLGIHILMIVTSYELYH